MQRLLNVAYEIGDLLERHPPRFTCQNKLAVYGVASEGRTDVGGAIALTRVGAGRLPGRILRRSECRFVVREDFFQYETPDAGEEHWYLNFAHSNLFAFYGGGLLAQDEMQVLEHPVLGSLRDAVASEHGEPLTTDDGRPTPILVRGAPRWCRIATEPDAREGRPFGLYGNRFSRAGEREVLSATEVIRPATISNILAMEAPAYGTGAYTDHDLKAILLTALTGFGAVAEEAPEDSGRAAKLVVHTGYWGCGAYGGNRHVMLVLQMIAAAHAGIDRLVIHTGGGREEFGESCVITDAILSPGGSAATDDVISSISGLGFEWGISDGN